MALAVLESASLTDAQFETISQLVKDLCGINLHQGKKELVKARLGKRLRALELSNFDDYVEYVRRDTSRDELTAMLDAISTNLTQFYREPQHFEHLADVVLPSLVSAAVKSGRRLRIWSAGCSSGEEAYTIAIMLHEHVPGLKNWDARILATDISTRVLARAREGVYDADRLEQIPAGWTTKYFTCIQPRPERRYRLNDDVRQLITFGRLNLMERWPMRGPFDVIFCRNVMIYFDKPTQARLIERFWELLGSGGTLFVGHSESLAGVTHRFEYVQPTVYQKT
jgi:chemotaxis protein methyltransferase CheR